MRRVETYVGSQVYEWVDSSQAQNTMTAIAKVCAAMFGTNTVANGLACTPTSPATMTVQLGAGEIYQLESLEATLCGTLPANTAYQIVKQGIQLGTVTSATLAAPLTSGQSINYLIEAQYQDQDISLDPTTGNTPVVLQFYDALNPTVPWSGPNNSGATSNTFRDGIIAYTIKAGSAATTGSQVTPTPDSGYVGLWVVTVSFGQTTITSGSISAYAGAPILPASILSLLQSGNLQYGVDVSSTVNVVQASFPLPPTSVGDTQPFWVKIKNTNTGATTFTPNPGVIAASPLVGAAHAALQGGELVANGRALIVWRPDITSFVLIECSGGAVQVGAATQSQHAAQFGQLLQSGQCRLAKSGANLVLSPYNGNKLIINGIPQSIPSAGVSLAATGMTVSSLYYIYAYMNSGVMTLEASTTGHVTDSTTGVEIKSGDPTRTLVGMASPITGPAWQDTAAQRFVRSWFNDPGVAGNAGFTSNHATTSTSYVELGTEIRNEFLCWAGEIVLVGGSGISSQTGTGLNSTAVGFDGISTLEPGSYSAGYVAVAGGFAVPYTISFPKTGLSEGYHYATLAGKVQSGNGTWSGGTYLPGTTDQCSLTTYIKK